LSVIEVQQATELVALEGATTAQGTFVIAVALSPVFVARALFWRFRSSPSRHWARATRSRRFRPFISRHAFDAGRPGALALKTTVSTPLDAH